PGASFRGAAGSRPGEARFGGNSGPGDPPTGSGRRNREELTTARRSLYTISMADPVRKQPAGGVLDDDPFFYGSRWISVRLPDGRIVDEQIPLTPDDLLDPQPGDQVTQSDKHVEMMIWLFLLLKRHFDSREDIKVTCDMKMIWGIPKLPEPSPDVAVIPKIRDKHKERESFD